jgi:hypothetical protein
MARGEFTGRIPSLLQRVPFGMPWSLEGHAQGGGCLDDVPYYPPATRSRMPSRKDGVA